MQLIALQSPTAWGGHCCKEEPGMGTGLVLSLESAADLEAKRRKGGGGDWRLGS